MPPLPQQTSIPDLIPTLEADIPADSFSVVNLWIPAGMAAALAVVLALVLWLIFRKKQRPLPAPPTPQETALAAMTALEEEQPALRPCSLRLSLILRTFLEGQAHDSSLFETHEEFSQRLDSLAEVPAACRAATGQLLEELASLKYAPLQESDNLRVRRLINEARALVGQITEEQAREAAARKEDEA